MIYKLTIDTKDPILGKVLVRVRADQNNRANFVFCSKFHGVKVFQTLPGVGRITYRVESHEAESFLTRLLTKFSWKAKRVKK